MSHLKALITHFIFITEINPFPIFIWFVSNLRGSEKSVYLLFLNKWFKRRSLHYKVCLQRLIKFNRINIVNTHKTCPSQREAPLKDDAEGTISIWHLFPSLYVRTRQCPCQQASPHGLAEFYLSIFMAKDTSEPPHRLNLTFKRIFKKGKSSSSWQMEGNTQRPSFPLRGARLALPSSPLQQCYLLI